MGCSPDDLEVYGLIESTDEKYIKFKKIYDVCEEAGTSLPEEVDDYFDGFEPEFKLKQKLKVKNNDRDMITVIELLVKDIPEGVEKICFEMNWD